MASPSSVVVTLTAGIHTVEWVQTDGSATLTGLDVASASAQPHALRFDAGGALVYATISPGADVVGASRAAVAGPLGSRGLRGMAGASVTSSAGTLARSAATSIPGASSAASAGTLAIIASTLEHRLRFDAGSATVLVTMVPGADVDGKAATSGAGAVAAAGVLQLPAASSTATGGSLTSLVPVPSASCTSSAGALGQRATVSVPGASATAGAGALASKYQLPAAAPIIVSAGTVGLTSAIVPLPGASSAAVAGAMLGSLLYEVPGAQTVTSAGALEVLAALGLGSGTSSAQAGPVSQRPTGTMRAAYLELELLSAVVSLSDRTRGVELDDRSASVRLTKRSN